MLEIINGENNNKISLFCCRGNYLINEMRLMAFDILPMSKIDGEVHVNVAASLKFEDGKIKEWGNINRRKLLQLIRKYKPRFIGTDNPEEILFPGEGMDRFYHLIPPTCNLVHVNSNQRGVKVKISSLIRKHRIEGWEKRSPLKTARALIQLMEFGEGVILEPFEDETIIRIGQPKRHKKGGWSQSRYERQNEEVVAHATEEVKSILDTKGVAYDLIERKTKFGSKFAKFHTFLPRGAVGEYFTKINLRPAKIVFESPPKANITRKNLDRIINSKDLTLSKYEPRIIVGVDPGTTVGISILDLNGNIIDVFSLRDTSKGEVVHLLTDYGIPVVFCTDVSPIPLFVRKLSATFDAEIITPTIELRKVDKRALVGDTNIKLRNTHEIDALAAAINGFKHVRNRLDKINKYDLNPREKDLAKALIIRGLSSTDAAQAVLSLRIPDQEVEVKQREISPDQQLINRVNNLLAILATSEETIANLRNRVARTESQVEFERKQKEKWHYAMQRLRDENTRESLKDEMLQSKSLELNSIREELSKQNQKEIMLKKKIKSLEETLWIGLQEGTYPIKVMPIFSHNGIAKLYDERLSEGDIILILDASGGGTKTALALANKKPRFIFLKETEFAPEVDEMLFDMRIPILDADNYNIKVLDTVAIINPLDFEKALKDYEILADKRIKKRGIQSFISEVENYQFEKIRQLEKDRNKYDNYEFEENNFTG
jgi:uncharacterized protein